MKAIKKIAFFYLFAITAFASQKALACEENASVYYYPSYSSYHYSSYDYVPYPCRYYTYTRYSDPYYVNDACDDYGSYYRPVCYRRYKTSNESSYNDDNDRYGYRAHRRGMTYRYNTGTCYSKALNSPYYYNYDNTYGPNFGDRAYDDKEVDHWFVKRNLEAIRRDQRLLDMANDLDEVEKLHEDIQKRAEVLNSYGVRVD